MDSSTSQRGSGDELDARTIAVGIAIGPGVGIAIGAALANR
jgi:hypothetical protein